MNEPVDKQEFYSIYTFLRERVEKQEFTNYKETGKQIDRSHSDPELWRILGAINVGLHEAEPRNPYPMLSVIVQGASKLPGSGFFYLKNQMYPPAIESNEEFCRQENERAFAISGWPKNEEVWNAYLKNHHKYKY